MRRDAAEPARPRARPSGRSARRSSLEEALHDETLVAPGPPGDDLAQSVLRALLAWPALGLLTGLVTAGLVQRDLARNVVFAFGAGCGAALLMAVVDASSEPLRRRRPWLAATIGPLLVAALSPASLLGGEFLLAWQETVSSRAATQVVLGLHEDDPLDLLAVDIGLGAGLSLAGLVAGRSLGWRPTAQAAIGAWIVLAGLSLRLAAGRLDHAPIGLISTVELGLATVGPFAVQLADRGVRAVRRRETERLPWLLGSVGGALAAAALWAAIRTAAHQLAGTPLLPPLATGLCVALALGSSVCAAAALARSSPPTQVRRRWPARGGLASALLLAAAGSAAVRDGDPATMSGIEAQVRLGLALELDPLAHWRRVEAQLDQPRPESPWRAAVPYRRPLAWQPYEALLLRAIDLGDVEACSRMCKLRSAHGATIPEEDRAWLRFGAAGGELDCALELVTCLLPPDPDADVAADALVAAARRSHGSEPDPRLKVGLERLWYRQPARRAELEPILLAAPDVWHDLMSSALWSRTLSRSLRKALLVELRHRRALRPPSEVEEGLLVLLLDRDPTLTVPEGARPARGPVRDAAWWPPALGSLLLGPLDPGPPSALDVVDGEWAEVSEDTTALWGHPDADPDELRARFHGLLVRARTRGPAEDCLELAKLLRARAGYHERAAQVFDELLLILHQACYCPSEAPHPGVVAALFDVVLAMSPGRPDVQRRVELLRPLALSRLGAVDQDHVAGVRGGLARQLEALAQAAWTTDDVRDELRAAAVRLHATR